MKEAVVKLFKVKSILTLMLTILFCITTLKGITSQEFMAIYTMVIGFYFGTQANKKEE